MDSQIEEFKKKADLLKENYDEVSKLSDAQRDNLHVKDQRFWTFLKQHKEILIEIKDWEIYRCALETTKELNVVVKGKALDSLNHLKEHHLIRINPEPLVGKGSKFILDMNYYWFRTIQDLLDSVWKSLLYKFGIPPYRYKNTWLLKDAITGQVFDEIGIGSQYRNEAYDKYIEDKRSLKDVGIYPGMELLIIPGYKA